MVQPTCFRPLAASPLSYKTTCVILQPSWTCTVSKYSFLNWLRKSDLSSLFLKQTKQIHGVASFFKPDGKSLLRQAQFGNIRTHMEFLFLSERPFPRFPHVQAKNRYRRPEGNLGNCITINEGLVRGNVEKNIASEEKMPQNMYTYAKLRAAHKHGNREQI